jgi:hypothetical protein
MHRFQNIALASFISLAAIFFLDSCAAANSGVVGEAAAKSSGYEMQQQEKQLLLEKTFADLIATVRAGSDPEAILPFITDSSEYWFDSLEVAAQTENQGLLEQRPFCEVYMILLYRLYEREHLWTVQEDRMISLAFAKKGMLLKLTELELGPMEVKNDRGSIGLAQSPKVPVLLFTWDDLKWELDVVESFPLATKGIESIGVKKNWSNTKLALYLLEKEYRYDYSSIDESLLEPIPSI